MGSPGGWLPRIATLVAAARRLEIPILATEQYSQRLGATLAEVGLTPRETRIEKMTFSCCGEASFGQALRDLEREQVILCGIEAHICVQATALDLLRAGYEVFVAADATASRLPHTQPLGLNRMAAAGAVLASVESVIFECLDRGDDEAFKALLPLLKELS